MRQPTAAAPAKSCRSTSCGVHATVTAGGGVGSCRAEVPMSKVLLYRNAVPVAAPEGEAAMGGSTASMVLPDVPGRRRHPLVWPPSPIECRVVKPQP